MNETAHSLDSLLTLRVKPSVVVPFPQDEAVLSTILFALEQGWADFLLIGNRDSTLDAARSQGLKNSELLSTQEWISCFDEEEACVLAAKSVAEGRAGVGMKGAVHTASFSRAMFSSSLGLMEPGRLGSHVGVCEMDCYPRPLLLTDCAINIMPTYEQKVQILRNAVELAMTLGIKAPKIALVAPVETVNPKIPATVDGARLKEEYLAGTLGDLGPNLILDGPFGLDVALSAEAARIKGISTMVAGSPDILLFPELNSGNVGYKAFRFAGNATIAAVLLGGRAPLVVNSRSDPDRTKRLSLKLGIFLAGQMGD